MPVAAKGGFGTLKIVIKYNDKHMFYCIEQSFNNGIEIPLEYFLYHAPGLNSLVLHVLPCVRALFLFLGAWSD